MVSHVYLCVRHLSNNHFTFPKQKLLKRSAMAKMKTCLCCLTAKESSPKLTRNVLA